MDKVDVSDNCWEWHGARGGSGHGQFWNGTRTIPAHWFLLSRFPDKQLKEEACHKCDNKLCVRPDHIFIGTRSDNMRDMVAKNRHNPAPGCRAMLAVRVARNGETNSQSKLTERQAKLAKACPKRRGAAAALAKLFGVSETVISGIRKGTRWAHLPNATARQRAEAFVLTLG